MDTLVEDADDSGRFTLPRGEMEQRGRVRSFWQTLGTAGVLLGLQGLPWLVATGRGPAVPGSLPAATSAQVSLVAGFLFLLALAFHTVRAYELALMYRHWSDKRPADDPRLVRWARRRWLDLETPVAGLGAVLVGAGGAVMAVQMVRFWVGADTARRQLHDPVLTGVMWLLVGGGLAVLWAVCGGYAVATRDERRSRRDPTGETYPTWTHEPEPKPEWSPDALRALPSDEVGRSRPFGTIIACSGGGIRSAAFCLGGLQVLSAERVYDTARYVVGVSGGGYIASAMHVLRARHDFETLHLSPPVFAEGSPEEAWLRRNTRVLLESAQVAALGCLALTFGVVVNCFLVGLVLLALAWWMSWVLVASGAVTGVGSSGARLVLYHGDWAWLGGLGALPLLALGVYVAVDGVDRLWAVPSPVREASRIVSSQLLGLGLVALLLLYGLPAALVGLSQVAGGTGAPAVLARVVVGGQGTTTGGAPTVVSLGTVLAAVVTVLASIRAHVPGSTTRVDGRLQRLRRVLVARVLPWTALAVIVVVAVGLVLHWTAELVREPARLGEVRHAWWLGLALMALALLTDANRTSLHFFYRERLSRAFVVERAENGSVAAVDYRIPLRFAHESPNRREDETSTGARTSPGRGHGPALITCAVANAGDTDLVPADRNCVPFSFGHDAIGLAGAVFPTRARTPSALFEVHADRRYRVATIPAAMAMSGAAVSPVAGRFSRQLAPYRVVLALANARLGVWLPNPLWVDSPRVLRRLVRLRDREEVRSYVTGYRRAHGVRDDGKLLPGPRPRVATLRTRDQAWWDHVVPADPNEPGDLDPAQAAVRWRWRAWELVRALFNRPGFLRLAKEAFGRNSVYDRFLYITDGGHYDNLGLVESLRHRPRDVIVLDASSDPEDSFRVLGGAIATARMDLGVEIALDPTDLRRRGDQPALVAHTTGRISYPNGGLGTLHYVKTLVPQHLGPWDVHSYQLQHPDFPRTSTAHQLYGEFDLEAYRVLGREAVRDMLTALGIPTAAAPPAAPPAASPAPPPAPPRTAPPCPGVGQARARKASRS